MIETVAKTALYVNENLLIRRNRIQPEEGCEDRGRICVVTGAHGDELEGQFVCYELIRRINESAGNGYRCPYGSGTGYRFQSYVSRKRGWHHDGKGDIQDS